MAGDGSENKPWDNAVNDKVVVVNDKVGVVNDKVGDSPKSARNAANDGVGQAKSFVSSNVNQVKDIFGANVEQAKELTSTARVAIRRVGAQALEGIRTAVSPVVQVFEKAESKDGTELRKQISGVRMQLNEQLHNAQLKLKDTQKATSEQLVPVRAALADAQTQLIKVNAFRREHPEAAAAGLVAVVGLPSLLLRGKLIAARNVLVAVGGGAAVAYGSDRLAAKKK